MRARAVILAGGEGTRLGVLTAKRAKPAVPFAGKYRIIDFTLSNCANSGVFDVLVLTQYRPHSLNEHIARGRPWDMDRSFSGGVQLLQPFKGRQIGDWYKGTADAVTQNLSFVTAGNPEVVLILSGDHIYEMDYAVLVDFHQKQNADVTICTIRVPMDEAPRYGILDTDEEYRVISFLEKPANPPSNLASMGVYVFDTKALDKVLTIDQKRRNSNHDFGKDIVPYMMEQDYRVFAYPFGGYWIDVGTLDAYWEAHMDLLGRPPSLDLMDRNWVIHTRSEERPPVFIQAGAMVRDSLITDGSVIAPDALVERSVLSPGVYVGPEAVVRESIILTDTYIEAGAVIERCVIDKICVVGHNAVVGEICEIPGDLGITTVGKNTYLPAEIKVGRGAVIGADLRPEDFNGRKELAQGAELGIVRKH
ncbi:MAG: glucose-1-phosphate adenylyltransferase [Anaerolineae bacterium]|nr:glucose-1-phosphate adenylyltransferase [Anaerolineae bacterium]